MPRSSRTARLVAAVERTLEHSEHITDRGVCWAAVRRPRVPLLFLGRNQYDVVLTDRRILLFARRRRGRVGPDDVALAKRYSNLTMQASRSRGVLLQHIVRTNTGSELVLEWRPRYRRVGRWLAAALEHP